MPIVKFLEEYPLYRKYKFEVPVTLEYLDKPAIHLICPNCDDIRTFLMINEYYDPNDKYRRVSHKSAGAICEVIYLCAACKSFQRHFLLIFSNAHDYVMKIGQYPPWEISIDKNLSKILGDHAALYKKGLVSESQSYGIGAVAYYRRMIEEIIDDLLRSIEDLIPASERGQYQEAMAKVMKTKITQDKIELVKDLLPSILKPDNVNPLSILHDSLSEGLHDKNENECLEISSSIRESLVFLVNQVLLSKEKAKVFTKSMRKTLAKKSKKKA